MTDRVHRALTARIGVSIRTGRMLPPAGSLPRLSNGIGGVRHCVIALDIAGDRAVAWEDDDPMGRVGILYLGRQGACLGGGTTEIARNIISERFLDMPREAAEDLDRPYREVRTNTMPTRK